MISTMKTEQYKGFVIAVRSAQQDEEWTANAGFHVDARRYLSLDEYPPKTFCSEEEAVTDAIARVKLLIDTKFSD